MRLLILALLPSVLLFIYVWKKDQAEKEPIGLLVKIFIFGMLSIIPAVILESIADVVFLELWAEESATYIIVSNFIGVALVEEWGKRKAAKLAAWKHPAFNYKFDAIVYCIVSALGFATLENILYVFENGVEVAISRALLAVPSHAIDGLIMGYFFGLAKEAEVKGDKRRKKRFYRLSLIVPMLEHGAYDAALSTDSTLIFVLFFVMVISVDIWAFIFIRKQSKEDKALFSQAVMMDGVQLPAQGQPLQSAVDSTSGAIIYPSANQTGDDIIPPADFSPKATVILDKPFEFEDGK